MNFMGNVKDVVCVSAQDEYNALKERTEKEKEKIGSNIKGILEIGKDKAFLLDYEEFAVVVYKLGMGIVAASQSCSKIIREYGNKLENVYLIGTCGCKSTGMFAIDKTYQEVDLRPLGFKLGESPDQPLYYECDKDKFQDLPKGNSLTVQRFVIDFPDTSFYRGLNLGTPIIDMEDYAFMASFEGLRVKRYILRGVSDAGDGGDWVANTKNVMTDLWDKVSKEFDR